MCDSNDFVLYASLTFTLLYKLMYDYVFNIQEENTEKKIMPSMIILKIKQRKVPSKNYD